MRIHGDLAQAIGNTPLLKLRRASEMTGCTILGKCEFLNPGQSVKDRAALYIIRDAVARGALQPGGTIVEGTAGNTGIGLALVGASHGVQDGDRDPRNPKPGKEGHDPAGRGRTGAGARSPLPQPQQLCPLFGPSGRGAGARPNPMARSGPTSSTTWPTARRISRPPGRKSGTRRVARSMALSARSARAARWRVWRWPCSPRA